MTFLELVDEDPVKARHRDTERRIDHAFNNLSITVTAHEGETADIDEFLAFARIDIASLNMDETNVTMFGDGFVGTARGKMLRVKEDGTLPYDSFNQTDLSLFGSHVKGAHYEPGARVLFVTENTVIPIMRGNQLGLELIRALEDASECDESYLIAVPTDFGGQLKTERLGLPALERYFGTFEYLFVTNNDNGDPVLMHNAS